MESFFNVNCVSRHPSHHFSPVSLPPQNIWQFEMTFDEKSKKLGSFCFPFLEVTVAQLLSRNSEPWSNFWTISTKFTCLNFSKGAFRKQKCDFIYTFFCWFWTAEKFKYLMIFVGGNFVCTLMHPFFNAEGFSVWHWNFGVLLKKRDSWAGYKTLNCFFENPKNSYRLKLSSFHKHLLISIFRQAVIKWYRRQSSDTDTPIPYICSIIGTLLWLRYAIFIEDLKLILLQSYAAVMQSFFIITMIVYRSRKVCKLLKYVNFER